MTARVTENKITPGVERMKRELRRLPREVYNYWVDITPKDTGNAKRSTHLRGNVIHANYAYASRLDEGYSRQAPKGMSEPTNKFVEKRVNEIIRK